MIAQQVIFKSFNDDNEERIFMGIQINNEALSALSVGVSLK